MSNALPPPPDQSRDRQVDGSSNRPKVACYISGHGFGHAARVCEVLRALRLLRPDAVCVIRSSLARWFFDFNLTGAFEHEHCQLYVGAVQADSLSVDIAATYRAYAAIDTAAAELVEAECACLAAC